MHPDEVEADATLVHMLLTEQFPQWADLPLAVPVTRAIGRPAQGYPLSWSVAGWLPGENANRTAVDLEQMAVNLAGFIKALEQVVFARSS